MIEGHFRWTDGTAYEYRNWHSGEAATSNRHENCVELWGEKSQWNDKNCNTRQCFICKKKIEIGKKINAYNEFMLVITILVLAGPYRVLNTMNYLSNTNYEHHHPYHR